MYKIGFNGKKLWIFDYQFADWDASKANFLRELNWKRTDEGFDKEEDALWGSEDSDF